MNIFMNTAFHLPGGATTRWHPWWIKYHISLTLTLQ